MLRFFSVSVFFVSTVLVFTGFFSGCSDKIGSDRTLPRKSVDKGSLSETPMLSYKKGLSYYSMWVNSDRTAEPYLLQALSLFRKSCDQKFEKACMAYLTVSSEQKKAGTDLSIGSEMCLRGYPGACRIFWNGIKHLSRMEFPAAVSIYRATIEKSCLSGLLEPCRLLTNRKYTKKNDSELALWLAKSLMSTGESLFEYRLSRLMVKDFHEPIFSGKSSGMLEELFSAGSRVMGMYAGLAYYYGWWGYEKDRNRAVSLFFEGCRLGYSASCRAYFYLASARGTSGSRQEAIKYMDNICSGKWKHSITICFIRDFVECSQKSRCRGRRTAMENFLLGNKMKRTTSNTNMAREALALMLYIKMSGREHDGKYLKSVLGSRMDVVSRACWFGSPWFCRALVRMGYEPLLTVKRTHVFIKEISSIPEDDLLLDVIQPFRL